MKNNKRRGIFRQVITPLTIFQIMLIFFMLISMYFLTLYSIWNEKKEASQQISDYTAEMLGDYLCIGRITDYLHENYEKIAFVYDDGAADIKERELSQYIPGYISAKEVTPEQFDTMSDEVRQLYAQVCYIRISLEMDKIKQNRKPLYLAAVLYCDEMLFYIAEGVLENEGRVSQGGKLWELGMSEPYSLYIGESAKLDNLVGVGREDAFVLPVFADTDEEAVYTFTPVYDEDGRLVMIVTAANKWTEFLIEGIEFTLILFVTVTFLVIIQLWKTARLLLDMIVRPIRREQDILNEFIEEKQSEKVVSELAEIRTDNEIQTFAENFSYMASELDKYTKELISATAEKERMATELDLATKIQSGMLPNIFPAFPDRPEFDIYASMDPAKEVGGDFYDFFMTDDDHLAMVIADVSGKGVPAALFMISAKILINDHTLMGGTPAEILEKVNKQVCANNKARMFVTVWLGILEISTGKLMTSSAGHEYPILCLNGKYEILKDKHGPPVGTFKKAKYTNHELTLKKGDSIFVYTDGVAEATDADNQLFGTERLLDTLNAVSEGTTQQDILKAVRAAVDDFVKETPQFDDLTMLGLKYFGTEENK